MRATAEPQGRSLRSLRTAGRAVIPSRPLAFSSGTIMLVNNSTARQLWVKLALENRGYSVMNFVDLRSTAYTLCGTVLSIFPLFTFRC
jgi:hypothetical protein